MFTASATPYFANAGPMPITCAVSENSRSAAARLARCEVMVVASDVGGCERLGSDGGMSAIDTSPAGRARCLYPIARHPSARLIQYAMYFIGMREPSGRCIVM